MAGDIHTVIDRCYAASLDGARWPEALTAIADYVGGTDTTLELHRGTGVVPLFFAAGTRLPMHGIDAYLAHYATVCPRIAYIGARPSGGIGFDLDFISEAEMDRDEFYADFLAPDDLRYFVSATLAGGSDGTVSFAAVHRSPHDGHASKRDMRRLERLIPHLRQALDTHLQLDARRQRESTLLEALGRLDVGVVLLDAAGGVIHANEAAEAIFRARDGLDVAGGRLHVENAAARRALAEILSGFLDGSLEAAIRPGGELFVPRPSGQAAYTLSVRRLPAATAAVNAGSPAAAIAFVHDPARVAPPAADRIAAAFGLTRREAELAAALHAGESLAEHAAARGIRLSTARFHLYQAMSKVGVHRQSELVRLIDRLLPPLG